MQDVSLKTTRHIALCPVVAWGCTERCLSSSLSILLGHGVDCGWPGLQTATVSDIIISYRMRARLFFLFNILCGTYALRLCCDV